MTVHVPYVPGPRYRARMWITFEAARAWAGRHVRGFAGWRVEPGPTAGFVVLLCPPAVYLCPLSTAPRGNCGVPADSDGAP